MALHFIAKKNNLLVGYQEYDKLKKIGIEVFIGEQTYNKMDTIELLDNNFLIGSADKNGCLTGAGYKWCNIKHKCLKFDELCN
jgi:hypothetical protein